jgi:hypothetical protein
MKCQVLGNGNITIEAESNAEVFVLARFVNSGFKSVNSGGNKIEGRLSVVLTPAEKKPA